MYPDPWNGDTPHSDPPGTTLVYLLLEDADIDRIRNGPIGVNWYVTDGTGTVEAIIQDWWTDE